MDIADLTALEKRLKIMRRLFQAKTPFEQARANSSVSEREALAFRDFVRIYPRDLHAWFPHKIGMSFQKVADTYSSVDALCDKLIADQETRDLATRARKEQFAAKNLEDHDRGIARQVEKKGGDVQQDPQARFIPMSEWGKAVKGEPGLYTVGIQPCVGVAIFNNKTGAMALAHLAEDQDAKGIIRDMMGWINPTWTSNQCIGAVVTGEPWEMKGSALKKPTQTRRMNPLYSDAIHTVLDYQNAGVLLEVVDLTDETLGGAALQVLPNGQISRFQD